MAVNQVVLVGDFPVDDVTINPTTFTSGVLVPSDFTGHLLSSRTISNLASSTLTSSTTVASVPTTLTHHTLTGRFRC